MPEPSPQLVDTIARVLSENGVGGVDASLHSWRCGYPDIYGPCTCTDELVNDLARAALAAMPQPVGYGIRVESAGEQWLDECMFTTEQSASHEATRSGYDPYDERDVTVVALIPVEDQ